MGKYYGEDKLERAKGTEQQAMPPVIKPFPHVLKSILYTFLYTFSRRLMTYSGKYLPEFFRLSPMKLVGFTCFYPTVSHNFCSGMIKSSGHVHYSLLTSCCVSLVACRSVIALRFFSLKLKWIFSGNHTSA